MVASDDRSLKSIEFRSQRSIAERTRRPELTCIRCPRGGCGGSCLIGLVAGRGGGGGSLGVRRSGRRRGYRVSRLPGLVRGGAGRPVHETTLD